MALTPTCQQRTTRLAPAKARRHVVMIDELRRTLPTVLTLSRRADGSPAQRLT